MAVPTLPHLLGGNAMLSYFSGFKIFFMVAVIAMIVVIVAIAMDLLSGWRKAKLRGDARTSYAFSRTITKFMLYEGVLMISCGIDTMIHFVWANFHEGTIYIVPCVTCLIAIVLCFVEIWSIKEKADKKTRKNLTEVLRILTESLSKEQIIEMLNKETAKKGGEDGND